MFKRNTPRKIQVRYASNCTTCGGHIAENDSAYWLKGAKGSKSSVWHVKCYEESYEGEFKPSGAQAAPDVPPPDDFKDADGGQYGSPQDAQAQADASQGQAEAEQGQAGQGEGQSSEGDNMDGQEQGSAGAQGQGPPPPVHECVLPILNHPDKLSRHLHRADLYAIRKGLGQHQSCSQASKEQHATAVSMHFDICKEWVETGERPERKYENGVLVHPAWSQEHMERQLLKMDERLRTILMLPERSEDPFEAAAQAKQLEQAIEEAEQAKQKAQQEMAEAQAERRAAEQILEEAKSEEGKIRKIILPDKSEVDVSEQHEKYPDLVTLVAAGMTVMMVGPAGGGKTEAGRSLAKEMGRPFVPLSLGPQTTQFSIFGYTDASGEYVRTPFREAFENGGIILLDEFDRCNGKVSVTLNAAIAQRYCSFPDGTVNAHDDCVIIAAANTAGHGADRQYVSAQQQDAATLDRFAVLHWGYDLAFERKIVLAQGCEESLALQWLDKVRRVRDRVAQLGLRYVVSPRASIHGAKLLAAGASWTLAEDSILFRGWTDHDRERVQQ